MEEQISLLEDLRNVVKMGDLIGLSESVLVDIVYDVLDGHGYGVGGDLEYSDGPSPKEGSSGTIDADKRKQGFIDHFIELKKRAGEGSDNGGEAKGNDILGFPDYPLLPYCPPYEYGKPIWVIPTVIRPNIWNGFHAISNTGYKIHNVEVVK